MNAKFAVPIVLAIIGILAIPPSVAQGTYTHDQYVSMIPNWDKIDTDKLVTIDDAEEYATAHPDLSDTEILHHFHRSWILLTESTTLIDTDTVYRYRYLTQDSPFYTIFYVWMPTLNRDDGALILVGFNTTTHEKIALWSSTDPDWTPSELPQNDFPKTICDYSISDFPLKSNLLHYAIPIASISTLLVFGAIVYNANRKGLIAF